MMTSIVALFVLHTPVSRASQYCTTKKASLPIKPKEAGHPVLGRLEHPILSLDRDLSAWYPTHLWKKKEKEKKNTG